MVYPPKREETLSRRDVRIGRMDAATLRHELFAQAPLIGPSLLACDFANLGREVQAVEEAGARILHLDIMDGHFVPNLSFGLPVVEAVRRVTELPLDVHLMISNPAQYVRAFRKAGADCITFHVEACDNPLDILGEIHKTGALAGVAISPPTPIDRISPLLVDCDLVLVMTVMPGFGGQAFQPETIDKVRWVRDHRKEGTLISVDGGINGETIGPCAAAGADLFVVGTGLFGYPDYRQRYAYLRGLAQSAVAETV